MYFLDLLTPKLTHNSHTYHVYCCSILSSFGICGIYEFLIFYLLANSFFICLNFNLWLLILFHHIICFSFGFYVQCVVMGPTLILPLIILSCCQMVQMFYSVVKIQSQTPPNPTLHPNHATSWISDTNLFLKNLQTQTVRYFADQYALRNIFTIWLTLVAKFPLLNVSYFAKFCIKRSDAFASAFFFQACAFW